jgi:hypothetical protein
MIRLTPKSVNVETLKPVVDSHIAGGIFAPDRSQGHPVIVNY